MNEPSGKRFASGEAAGAEGQALYLFALADARPGDLDVSVAGLDEETPVRVVPCGDWTAVVDTVDRAAWTGEEAEANMQSLAWVGPRAVRHEEVVEAVMDAAPVFPARFGTLFSSVDELQSRIDARAGALAEYFDLVAGREEWSVKGMLDREAAQEALADEGTESDEDSPGAAYLRQRKRVQEARADVESWLDDVAAELHDRLRDAAAAVQVLDPTPRPNDAGEAVLHVALLAGDDATSAVRAVLRRANDTYRDRGLTLELSGPWPPYNFRPVDDDWSPPDLQT